MMMMMMITTTHPNPSLNYFSAG